MRNVASQIFNFRTIVRLLLNSLDIALCLHPPLPPYKSTHPAHKPNHAIIPSESRRHSIHISLLPPRTIPLWVSRHRLVTSGLQACSRFLLQYWGLQDQGSLVMTRKNWIPTHYSAKICIVHHSVLLGKCWESHVWLTVKSSYKTE